MPVRRHGFPALLYPIAGTMADRILEYVRANPGCSTNNIIVGLDINPSPTRACIKVLVQKHKIEDRPEDDQHRWFAVVDE